MEEVEQSVRPKEEPVDEAVSTPEVPHTWRPRTVRMVAYGLGLLIVVTFAVMALILPVDWRVLDRVMLVGFGVLVAGGLHLLGRPCLTAEENRVLVVNGIRTHVLSWQEILDIQMPEGEPWPSVDLSDGTSLPVMGIQRTDGGSARQAVEDFRVMLRRGEAEDPGLS